jgi:hypothetical protein
MPDLEPKPIRLSDLNSVLFLGFALAVAAVVVTFLVRDYIITRRRTKRFYRKRKPPEVTETPPS